ncbi:Elicitin [Phytophthora megakarya]|uniref:Elicitin n=1 Tax=Phytophthora megakarya TaxID=4795 RepID=A0A225VLK0_9STRA|nr:Elicitin [Phytophthora megakarya]
MLHLVFAVALLLSAALASTCTVFQIHTIIQSFDGVLSNDECSEYSSDASSLLIPCEATSCITAVKDLAAKLPDCTLADGVNKKMELHDGLDECSANSSASLSVNAVNTSGSPATSTSRTGDECTIAEASTTANLYLEAAKSAACDPYVMLDGSTLTVSIYTPCSAAECVNVMEKMAHQLPDCYTDGANLRDDVLHSVSSCTGSSAISESSFSSQCSDDECESYIVTTSTEWYIAVPCNSTSCLATLDNAVDQMPDCEFQGTNYKKELKQQQQSCIDSSENESGSIANSLRSSAPAMNSTESSTSTTTSFSVITVLSSMITLIALI